MTGQCDPGPRRCAAVAVLTMAIGLGACTASDNDTAEVQRTTEPNPSLPVEVCGPQALYEIVVGEVPPGEFVNRASDEDLEEARAILYSEDHPRAGEYVPLEEWEREQRVAFGKIITARNGGWDDLLQRLHERMVEELTPEEFFARLSESEAELMRRFVVYADDHPRAGEFVPATEPGVISAWDEYLFMRPPGPGCPW